ncbi:MAG: hypothetical protein M1142_04550 [Patescibacteria group bacterium]|nr:hypothetical protein [Patescibacteria group bacterium]
MEWRGRDDPYSDSIQTLLQRRIVEFLRRYLGLKKAVTAILLVFILWLVVIGISEIFNIATGYKALFLSKSSAEQEEYLPKSSPLSTPIEKRTPMSDVRGLKSVDRPCQGESFDVIQQLDDVWGKERPFPADPDDPDVISASGSANFQVAKKYSFPCKAPFTAKLSFIPLKERSIGVFVEFEDVFKVLVGDGDRLTWKIEENSGNRKQPWLIRLREKMKNGPISLNKEATLILDAKPSLNGLDLKITFSYIPEGKSDRVFEYETSAVKASVTDLINSPARTFRIGLNDFRYKGSGSEIRFGAFSVKGL